MNVGSLELSANHNIEQIIELVHEEDKQDRLSQLLGTLLKQVSFWCVFNVLKFTVYRRTQRF
jgi:hypothetical protein